ncbi:28S ribosomal protein S5, mitochondrial [Elysia marginata]|uniref:Small ribosomal subunit protein uS5m n=1 Tax=Elysia marginata TaxID=1093978 RepID=A0AAV4GCP3_9GAST|nr:28S ribosomal protein S5, mitochondrial [Elysia marginata]
MAMSLLRALAQNAKPTIVSLSTIATANLQKVSANHLWDGVTSVSNAGKKRGRGRNAKKRVDLNRGQRLGIGKSGLVYPGLTGPALVGKEMLSISEKKEGQESSEAPRVEKRTRFPKIPALQRGYSGRKFPGTSIGPPDPINDYEFEGFDTRVLEYKMVSHMTGNLGRKMRVSALVVTGNGKGLAGFAVAKAPMGKAALRKAKNMAAQRLQYFERYNDHTVFHNFAVKEHKTTLFVQKMPKGHGLVCHRVLKTICQIIGIEDLHVKTEGRTGNIQNVTKAFFRGLMEQETHQQLADRMQLNVVEYRPELEWLPLPVASPSCGKSRDEPITEEAFDFENMYYQDGKIPLKKQKDPMSRYTKDPVQWKKFLQVHRDRNQVMARNMRIIHGLEPTKEEIKLRQKPLK